MMCRYQLIRSNAFISLLLLSLLSPTLIFRGQGEKLPRRCTSLDESIDHFSIGDDDNHHHSTSTQSDGSYELRVRRAIDQVMVDTWYEPNSEYTIQLTNRFQMVGFHEALLWLTPGRPSSMEDGMDNEGNGMSMNKRRQSHQQDACAQFRQQAVGKWIHLKSSSGRRGSSSSSATRYRSGCSRRVVQRATSLTGRYKITSLKVKWQAPPVNVKVPDQCRTQDTGCVTLHAAVRNRGGRRDTRIFANTGRLVKTLCPTSQRPVSAVLPHMAGSVSSASGEEPTIRLTRRNRPSLDSMQPQDCCACGSAVYRLNFTGLWSSKTHPKDWPVDNPGLLHWTNLIGASHAPSYQLYRVGGLASAGVQALCIYGDPTIIKQSFGVSAASGASKMSGVPTGTQSSSIGVGPLLSLITTPGMWSEDTLTESRSTLVAVNRTHPLISFLTMLGPSPNWCTGIASQSVCKADCTWARRLEIDLYPWDAGVRHGDTYIPENGDRKEIPDPIRIITHDWMRNNPFTPNLPVAHVSLERVLPERPSECKDELLDGVELFTSDGSTTMITMSGNSSSPSSGGQQRKTGRIQSVVGDLTGALPKKSRGKKGKGGQQAGGVGMDADNPLSDPTLAQMATFLCITSDWSPWSRCSVTCGIGKRSRSRVMEINKKTELCQHVPIRDEEICEGKKRTCDLSRPCSLLPWTEWTPCNATCTNPQAGVQRRKQFLARPSERESCQHIFRSPEERQTGSIIDTRSCVKSDIDCDPVSICGEGRKDGVKCGDPTKAFYYNSVEHACLPFDYLGCKGGRNRFTDKSQCEQFCLGPVERLPDWRRERMALLQYKTSQVSHQEGSEDSNDGFDAEPEKACWEMMDPGSQCPDGVLRKEIKWYFSPRTRRCVDFIYYGCNGTGNLFSNYTHCLSSCMPHEWARSQRLAKVTMRRTRGNSTSQDQEESDGLSQAELELVKRAGGAAMGGASVDCRASQWSGWTECSSVCLGGPGEQMRWRHIERPAKRGGQSCGELFQTERCMGSRDC